MAGAIPDITPYFAKTYAEHEANKRAEMEADLRIELQKREAASRMQQALVSGGLNVATQLGSIGLSHVLKAPMERSKEGLTTWDETFDRSKEDAYEGMISSAIADAARKKAGAAVPEPTTWDSTPDPDYGQRIVRSRFVNQATGMERGDLAFPREKRQGERIKQNPKQFEFFNKERKRLGLIALNEERKKDEVAPWTAAQYDTLDVSDHPEGYKTLTRDEYENLPVLGSETNIFGPEGEVYSFPPPVDVEALTKEKIPELLRKAKRGEMAGIPSFEEFSRNPEKYGFGTAKPDSEYDFKLWMKSRGVQRTEAFEEYKAKTDLHTSIQKRVETARITTQKKVLETQARGLSNRGMPIIGEPIFVYDDAVELYNKGGGFVNGRGELDENGSYLRKRIYKKGDLMPMTKGEKGVERGTGKMKVAQEDSWVTLRTPLTTMERLWVSGTKGDGHPDGYRMTFAVEAPPDYKLSNWAYYHMTKYALPYAKFRRNVHKNYIYLQKEKQRTETMGRIMFSIQLGKGKDQKVRFDTLHKVLSDSVSHKKNGSEVAGNTSLFDIIRDYVDAESGTSFEVGESRVTKKGTIDGKLAKDIKQAMNALESSDVTMDIKTLERVAYRVVGRGKGGNKNARVRNDIIKLLTPRISHKFGAVIGAMRGSDKGGKDKGGLLALSTAVRPILSTAGTTFKKQNTVYNKDLVAAWKGAPLGGNKFSVKVGRSAFTFKFDSTKTDKSNVIAQIQKDLKGKTMYQNYAKARLREFVLANVVPKLKAVKEAVEKNGLGAKDFIEAVRSHLGDSNASREALTDEQLRNYFDEDVTISAIEGESTDPLSRAVMAIARMPVSAKSKMRRFNKVLNRINA